MSSVYVGFDVCTVQIWSCPTAPPRSTQVDCAAAVDVPVKQARTPAATRIAATLRMRIVDVLESRHRLSAPAHYCKRTWRFRRAREEQKKLAGRTTNECRCPACR